MAATIGDLVRVMEDIAPPELALPDDRVGLQVGDREAPVKSVAVALDASNAVIDRALSSGVNAVVVHHPLIHKPVDRIVRDEPIGRRLLDAARGGLAVYIAHTNLDRASCGVNDVLAETIQVQNAEPLQVEERCDQYKLVVFVPKGHEDMVRDAACSAGAGVIGDYTFCTFQTEGVGTFMPAQSAQPFSGKVGTLNRAKELRLEMVVSAPFVPRVVDAIKRAHPYEEVAYDLLVTGQRDTRFSLGRIGELEGKLTLEEFATFVKKALKLVSVRMVGNKRKKLRRVATVAGGGARYVGAAAEAGADVLVTGDVGYHHAREAAARGLCLIDAGHAGTERVILEPLASTLRAKLGKLDRAIAVKTVHEPAVFGVL